MQSCKRKYATRVGSDNLKPHLIVLSASCLYFISQLPGPAAVPATSVMSLFHNRCLSLWSHYQINSSLYKLPLTIVFFHSMSKETNAYSDKDSK